MFTIISPVLVDRTETLGEVLTLASGCTKFFVSNVVFFNRQWIHEHRSQELVAAELVTLIEVC